MTLLCLPLTATVSFVIGYLPSERRAVKEANSILDANMKELFKAIGDAGAGHRRRGCDEASFATLDSYNGDLRPGQQRPGFCYPVRYPRTTVALCYLSPGVLSY